MTTTKATPTKSYQDDDDEEEDLEEEPSQIEDDASSPSKSIVVTKGNHRTERTPLLKLELTGDVLHQLETVKNKLFVDGDNQGIFFDVPAIDHSYWPTTDEILYKDAKTSYDNIYSAFMDEPRVFKLESVKEQVWSASKAELEGAGIYASLGAPRIDPKKRKKKKKKKGKHTSSFPSDDSTASGNNMEGTYLNPFAEGDFEQVWKEKLQLLEKLTPREDLDGYEYREDYDEQQYRMNLQKDFQERMKNEIKRRVERPTDAEQVEDVLFDMIETIAAEQDRIIEQKKLAKREYIRSLRHPATRESKLKPLLKEEAENGQIIQVVTDLDFADMVVTHGGYVMAPSIPNRVLFQHEQERKILKEIQRRQIEEREQARRQPLTQKLRSAVVLAKSDMRAAARQIMRDLVDKTILLPTEPMREKMHNIFQRGLKGLVDFGKEPEKSLNAFTDAILDTYDLIVEGQKMVKQNKKKQLSVEDLLAEAKRKQDEENAVNEEPEEDDKIDLDKSVKSKFPDSIMIKLTIEVEVPPQYVWRPRKTLRSEIKKLTKRAKIALEKNKAKVSESLNQMLNKNGISKADTNIDTASDVQPAITIDEKLTEHEDSELSGEEEEHFDWEEKLPLRKITQNPLFDGFIKPEELIIKPKEVSTPPPPNILNPYDNIYIYRRKRIDH